MEFLVFGEDYNRHPSSTQHLINEIKKTHNVQWINSIGMRKPSFNLTDINRILEKLGANKEKLYPEENLDYKNINIVKPLVYPLAENTVLKGINKFLMKRKIPKKDGLNRVVWLTLPSAVDYIEVTDADFVIYYCCDDFSGLSGVDHDLVPKKEKELIKRADLVFTTSDELYKKFKTEKTYMLPHGVHDIFFEVEDKQIKPEKVKLGFYGGIDTRINYDLIKQVLDSNSQFEIEMVGHIDSQIDKSFFEHPRINHIPALEHKQLTKKISEWDILLLPFLHNDYATHCNPLKLREYLATGKPIVTTNIPAVTEYSDFLEIEEGSENWGKAIDKIMKESNTDREKRVENVREILRKETWEERAKDAITMIINKTYFS